jgi:hypothetical protein
VVFLAAFIVCLGGTGFESRSVYVRGGGIFVVLLAAFVVCLGGTGFEFRSVYVRGGGFSWFCSPLLSCVQEGPGLSLGRFTSMVGDFCGFAHS